MMLNQRCRELPGMPENARKIGRRVLKIRVSVVRFRPWAPPRYTRWFNHLRDFDHIQKPLESPLGHSLVTARRLSWLPLPTVRPGRKLG